MTKEQIKIQQLIDQEKPPGYRINIRNPLWLIKLKLFFKKRNLKRKIKKLINKKSITVLDTGTDYRKFWDH